MDALAPTGPLRGPLRKRESNLWRRQADDWYVEPAWLGQRLFELERFAGDVCDPACGQGNISLAAEAHGYRVTAMDIAARGTMAPTIQDWLAYDGPAFDNIVSNPPFKLCDDRKAKLYPFVEKCLAKAKSKVALVLPSNWIQGDERSRWLERSPLRRIYFITPRPSMPPGEVLEAGLAPGNGTTDYAVFVWLQGYDGEAGIRWLRRKP